MQLGDTHGAAKAVHKMCANTGMLVLTVYLCSTYKNVLLNCNLLLCAGMRLKHHVILLNALDPNIQVRKLKQI